MREWVAVRKHWEQEFGWFRCYCPWDVKSILYVVSWDERGMHFDHNQVNGSFHMISSLVHCE